MRMLVQRPKSCNGWRALLSEENENETLPWLGKRVLRSHAQTWTIEGDLPAEHGWYTFKLTGRKAREPRPAEARPDLLKYAVKGYLVGDRLVVDGSNVDPDPRRIASCSERVHLLEPGLDRFVRIAAGRVFEDGPLVYQTLEMPVGQEEAVLTAFLDQRDSVTDVKGVTPALDAAFRMETWRRSETERRRRALEQRLREEEDRRQHEEHFRKLVANLGDAAGRRELAKYDFAQAARAALRVGGAELLDHRAHVRRGEWVVRYRLDGRRFECVCNEQLRILEAGVCLTDHDTGERGDSWLTLESLPSVIREADREGKLVVFRHV